MRVRTAVCGLAATICTALPLLPAPAHAEPLAPAPHDVQLQIDKQLADFPDGVQTSPNEVSYANGRVTVTFVSSADEIADACASDAYCFYDLPNFGGRKLTYRDCGGNQSLTDYGFGNKTSSWVNNTKHMVEVYDKDVTPFVTLWREAAKSAAARVSTATDNKADFFHTYCGA
ncbi:peptidase inhibitor family I36 protein [Actinomadura litoris]|uniref:peptidase inhibitor family I36 protein n=1 Tax=Actinomadura litoris TaxID=2678616 RepID=UPI001FA6D6F7|nr:peptidase inhibitor family I36 protein [Actinomadura litoris]